MNKFLFKVEDKITKKKAKELVGKHIHFTWHNKEDDTIETIPGLVLEDNDGMLKIYTMDIVFDDSAVDDSNRFVKDISYDELSNVFEFEKYKDKFWTLLDNIDDKDIISKEFEIKNVFGKSIKTKVVDYNIPLSLTIIVDDCEVEYPLYFIDSIKNI